MRVRFAPRARRDADLILRETLRLFGPSQFEVYAGYLDRAVQLLRENPVRASSRDRAEIFPGARSLHLDIAAGRRGAAAHLLVYRQMKDELGEPLVVVVRVLHESMDARRHASRGKVD